MKNIKRYFREWWKKHIIDECPQELSDVEFSNKHRKWK